MRDSIGTAAKERAVRNRRLRCAGERRSNIAAIAWGWSADVMPLFLHLVLLPINLRGLVEEIGEMRRLAV